MKDKVTQIHKGNGASGEKQGDAAEKKAEDVKLETALILFLSEDGRIGLQTQTGIPVKRIMKEGDVPAFLMQAAMWLNNTFQHEQMAKFIDAKVRSMLVQAAIGQAKVEAGIPEQDVAPAPIDGSEASELPEAQQEPTSDSAPAEGGEPEAPEAPESPKAEGEGEEQ